MIRAGCLALGPCRFHREQARSHRGIGAVADTVFTAAQCVRACSRRGWHIQYLCKLTRRFREQARSHRGVGLDAVFVNTPGWMCGQLLAGIHSALMQADPTLSRASPLPQWVALGWIFGSTLTSVAGGLAPAGLSSRPLHFSRQTALSGFAAAAQPSGSKLPRHGGVWADVIASKLAPTGDWGCCRYCVHHRPVWERACSR